MKNTITSLQAFLLLGAVLITLSARAENNAIPSPTAIKLSQLPRYECSVFNLRGQRYAYHSIVAASPTEAVVYLQRHLNDLVKRPLFILSEKDVDELALFRKVKAPYDISCH